MYDEEGSNEPTFGDTNLHQIFFKSKRSIQTDQHDRYIKVCL
jgi:hypothetical protein